MAASLSLLSVSVVVVMLCAAGGAVGFQTASIITGDLGVNDGQDLSASVKTVKRTLKANGITKPEVIKVQDFIQRGTCSDIMIYMSHADTTLVGLPEVKTSLFKDQTAEFYELVLNCDDSFLFMGSCNVYKGGNHQNNIANHNYAQYNIIQDCDANTHRLKMFMMVPGDPMTGIITLGKCFIWRTDITNLLSHFLKAGQIDDYDPFMASGNKKVARYQRNYASTIAEMLRLSQHTPTKMTCKEFTDTITLTAKDGTRSFNYNPSTTATATTSSATTATTTTSSLAASTSSTTSGTGSTTSGTGSTTSGGGPSTTTTTTTTTPVAPAWRFN